METGEGVETREIGRMTARAVSAGEREELAERSERTGSTLEEGREALVTSESKRRSWEREKREGKESEERRWREEWR